MRRETGLSTAHGENMLRKGIKAENIRNFALRLRPFLTFTPDMKTPRNLILAALTGLAVLTGGTPVNAAGHEKTFGVQAGYISRNQSAEAGLFFQYSVSRHFRPAMDATIAFRKQNRDALLVDLNAQMPFVTGDRFEVYPLAGINFSAWSLHLPAEAKADGDGNSESTNRTSRFGLNAGVGAGLRVTNTLKLKLEAIYTANKSNNAARVSIGIGYTF